MIPRRGCLNLSRITELSLTSIAAPMPGRAKTPLLPLPGVYSMSFCTDEWVLYFSINALYASCLLVNPVSLAAASRFKHYRIGEKVTDRPMNVRVPGVQANSCIKKVSQELLLWTPAQFQQMRRHLNISVMADVNSYTTPANTSSSFHMEEVQWKVCGYDFPNLIFSSCFDVAKGHLVLV